MHATCVRAARVRSAWLSPQQLVEPLPLPPRPLPAKGHALPVLRLALGALPVLHRLDAGHRQLLLGVCGGRGAARGGEAGGQAQRGPALSLQPGLCVHLALGGCAAPAGVARSVHSPPRAAWHKPAMGEQAAWRCTCRWSAPRSAWTLQPRCTSYTWRRSAFTAASRSDSSGELAQLPCRQAARRPRQPAAAGRSRA